MNIPVAFYNLEKANIEHHPRAKTVGGLVEILQTLPKELKIEQCGSFGCEVIVYNYPNTPFVEIEEIEEYDD